MFESKLSSLENVAKTFPDVLYKYRDWTHPKQKTILTDQQVYFAPPSIFWEMGDPDDCRFPIAWDFSFEASRPALDAGYPDPLHKARIPDWQYDQILRLVHDRRVGTEAARERSKNDYYNSGASFVGVLSVTGRNDNELIWQSDYAANGTGFCVGIDYRCCIQELAAASVGGGNIIYVPRDAPPLEYAGPSTHTHDEVMQLHMELVHTKYKDFEFEDEYRLTKRFPPEYFRKPIPNELRLFTVPKHCFRSVTFGYLMPQQSINEIIRVCADQQLPITFFIAKLRDIGTIEVVPYSAT